MKEIIKALEELKIHHERMRGAQKLGVSSHFWNGRVEGINDALKIIREATLP